MTFSQILSILMARKWVALSVLVLSVLATLVVSLLLPKQYTASTSVVVDARPDPVSTLGLRATVMPSFMGTQIDIINSDRVALRVIRDLKLLDNPQLRQQWQRSAQGNGTIEQWLVNLLQKTLKVRPSRDSNVIQIGYEARDPRFAAALANAFAQGYIATTLELRVDPAKQFNTFFETQAKEAREALEHAQSRVSTFQRENGIIANDERIDVETSRLNQLSSQLVQMQAISSESGSRLTQAEGASGNRLPEVLNNPLISGLKGDLTRNEARLQVLNSKFGDRHPQVIEAKANISELSIRIDAEMRKVTEGVAVTNKINKQREAQVKRQLEAQRAQVLRMKAVRDEGQVRVREFASAQRIYDTMMTRLNQTAIEAQSTQSFASVLSAAVPPTRHSSPKVSLNTAVSVFVGILLAVGIALLLELVDRRLRSPDDVMASLGAPVLGTLPRPSATRFASRKRISLMQQRVIGLPAPTGGA